MTFTIILFVCAGTIILLFNIAINNYLSTRQNPGNPPVTGQQIIGSQPSTGQPQPSTDDGKNSLRAKYSNDLERIKSKSIFGLIVFAFISLGLGYYLADRFLRPLNQLNRQLEKLKSDNLGTQITRVPDNEIGKTISYFNDMSLRLKTAFDQQAQFVQDASHELRTPLTILRTNLETELDNSNASKAELRNAMQDALLEIDSATELANDLLTLSKPEKMSKETENLGSVISEVVDSFSMLAKDRDVSLEYNATNDEVNASIVKSDFARAINNIIDNAIKYSAVSKAPKVLVSLRKSGVTAIIEIADNGIGIKESEIAKIFDRFYRIDKSRNRKTGEFGLGLAISKKIISDHEGKISVTSQKGLTKFRIQIPIA